MTVGEAPDEFQPDPAWAVVVAQIALAAEIAMRDPAPPSGSRRLQRALAAGRQDDAGRDDFLGEQR